MRIAISPWASLYFIDIHDELPRYHAWVLSTESGSGQ